MKNQIILVSKDAMCRSYLPVYGNSKWSGKSPNIDELASKGTVFTNSYTAAPSTAMAFLGMSTGKFPHELDIHEYSPLDKTFDDNIFNTAGEKGYQCHIIWDSKWNETALPYSKCFGDVTFHSLNLSQPVGVHFPHKEKLVPDEKKLMVVYACIEKEIQTLLSTEKLFLWIHLPHVLNGRISYGGDIDGFDYIVGILRKYFPDDSIYITADHGNMNGTHGKVCYGFDVYDEAIRIPLIIPRMNNKCIETNNFSMVDLYPLLFEDRIVIRPYIYVDSAYYKQPHRKLAIIQGSFKYIYNKQTNTEELYDLDFDRREGINLVSACICDHDRNNKTVPIHELIPYDSWDKLNVFLQNARQEKQRMWKEEGFFTSMIWKTRHKLGKVHTFVQMISNLIRMRSK